jgi:hypothetical protein
MKKILRGTDAYYTIAWSPFYEYDKYNALRIVPELPGIINLAYIKGKQIEHLIFYACWRDGCRVGLNKFLDVDYGPFITTAREITKEPFHYRYLEVGTSRQDFQDIMFWLIQTYNPRFNNDDFADSKRYRNIHVQETYRSRDDVVERLR